MNVFETYQDTDSIKSETATTVTDLESVTGESMVLEPSPVKDSPIADADPKLVESLLRQYCRKKERQREYDKKRREKQRKEIANMKDRLAQLEGKDVINGLTLVIYKNKGSDQAVYKLKSEKDYIQLIQDLAGTLKALRQITDYAIEPIGDDEEAP